MREGKLKNIIPSNARKRKIRKNLTNQSWSFSRALKRLGRGRNSGRRLIWRDDGFSMVAAKDLLNRSASTLPILLSEFTNATFLRFNPEFFVLFPQLLRFADEAIPLFSISNRRWKAHRKEPGCVVGEHKHLIFWLETATEGLGTFPGWENLFKRRLRLQGEADRWWLCNIWEEERGRKTADEPLDLPVAAITAAVARES